MSFVQWDTDWDCAKALFPKHAFPSDCALLAEAEAEWSLQLAEVPSNGSKSDEKPSILLDYMLDRTILQEWVGEEPPPKSLEHIRIVESQWSTEAGRRICRNSLPEEVKYQ